MARRFGAGSHLARVPLPDQDEQRELIVSAFTTRAREDLGKLARYIAAAQRDGQVGETAITAVHKRFLALQASAALKLVNVQLASLLAQAT